MSAAAPAATDIYLPAATAVRVCYLENTKECGAKFFVLHYDVPTLTIWARWGGARERGCECVQE